MKTEVVKIDPQDIDLVKIRKAASVVKHGGIVAFPTETVYGLAANFFNKQAVAKVFKVKKRSLNKPLTVQITDIGDLEQLACDISANAYQLMSRFWPGPLTLVFKAKSGGTIGVRIPNNQIAQNLIKESHTPIVAPSANLSHKPAATTAEEVLQIFDGLINLVIDAGKAQLGTASTVIDISSSPYKILRQGPISERDLQIV